MVKWGCKVSKLSLNCRTSQTFTMLMYSVTLQARIGIVAFLNLSLNPLQGKHTLLLVPYRTPAEHCIAPNKTLIWWLSTVLWPWIHFSPEEATGRDYAPRPASLQVPATLAPPSKPTAMLQEVAPVVFCFWFLEGEEEWDKRRFLIFICFRIYENLQDYTWGA